MAWSDDKLAEVSPAFSDASSTSISTLRKESEPSKAKKKRKSDNLSLASTTSETINSSFPSDLSPADPIWQNIDPTPDVRALFSAFDTQFFGNTLASVEVTWSSRMTMCAGICLYEGLGGLCSVRLSEPLLKFRPRSDLVETLLHEMIHAFLFISENNRDRESHGPKFRFHMNRINKIAKTKISVYHSFHNEVDNYKVHWWQCNGICSTRAPFFGLIRRAMNRAPGPNDLWWAEHQATCPGTFIKISEPVEFSKKNAKASSKVKTNSEKKDNHCADIRNFLCNSSESKENIEPAEGRPDSPGSKPNSKVESNNSQKFEIFGGEGRILGGAVDHKNSRLLQLCSGPFVNKNRAACSAQNGNNESCLRSTYVTSCPVCQLPFPMNALNDHLDRCLQ